MTMSEITARSLNHCDMATTAGRSAMIETDHPRRINDSVVG
jgi:hypothetical protein